MSEDKYYNINQYQRLNPTDLGIFFFDDNCDGNILIEWSEAPKMVVALIEIIKEKGVEGMKADEIWVDKLSRKERKILKKSEEEKDDDE